MSEIVDSGVPEIANGNGSLEEIEAPLTPEAASKKLEQDLQKRTIENEILKNRVLALEKELKKNRESGEVNGCVDTKADNVKKMEDVLVKAKELLFEKTKIGKRQEQQIAALNLQILSMKEVMEVTKDMLEIRNSEVQHLQTKIDTCDLRLKAEIEKQKLYERKMQISQKMYSDLRKEYDVQSEIFKELRKSYEMKNQLLSDELDKMQRRKTVKE